MVILIRGRGVLMANERLFLDNPPPVPTSVIVVGFEIFYRDPRFGTLLRVHLQTDTGEIETVQLTENAAAIIEALNRADMREKSLLERILTWLATNHPRYMGTVSG